MPPGRDSDGKGDAPTMADQTTLDLADLSFWDSTPEERAEAFAVLRRQGSVARYPMPATLWTPDPDPSRPARDPAGNGSHRTTAVDFRPTTRVSESEYAHGSHPD